MSLTAVQREWAERLARWERSGLSRDDFAAQEGISAKRLVRERWNLRQRSLAVRAEPAPSTAVSFVRLEPPSLPASVPLEVVLSSGRAIRVPVDFDEVTLFRIVTTLERGAV